MLTKVLRVLLVLDLVLVNGWIVYQFLVPNVKPSSNLQLSNYPNVTVQDACGEECKTYINQQLAARMTSAAPAGPSATPKPQVIYAPLAKKVTQIQYVTVPGSGTTGTNDWADIPGSDFYFNTADYQGLASVYYEVNLSLYNGNGTAFVRLFDVTHGIGVQGSDVQTSSQNSSVVTSGQVVFWSGRNLIRVQAKSLTADTTVYTSGRLRITTTN